MPRSCLPQAILPALVALAVGGSHPGAASAEPAPVRIERIVVHGAALEGNLEGNRVGRAVAVVLPPSYAKARDRRYPVVVFLHGFGVSADSYLMAAGIADASSNLSRRGIEMIIVVPDTQTRHGGSMYSSSPTIGDFETFITRDLVAHIDAHYRTLPRRESRGLAGHSMGGYGVLKLGMKHPDVFSSLYAMSPCCLEPLVIPPKKAQQIEAMTLPEVLAGDFLTRVIFASAAAWSADPERPPMYLQLPVDNGRILPSVMERWADHAPLRMLPRYADALRRMTAIALEVGDKDLPFIYPETLRMHQELERLGVEHLWSVYDGDHSNRLVQRFEGHVLPFFAKHLSSARVPRSASSVR